MAKSRSSLIPKPNYLVTIISISLVLFLLGLFALITLHTSKLSEYFKEQINIIVELKPQTGSKEIKQISEELSRTKEIIESSIVHISKEEAAIILSEEFGEDILLSDMPNPLFDVIKFNVKSEFLHKESLELLKSSLKRKFSAINDIYYQESLIEMVLVNIQNISFFILSLSGLVALVSIFLIFNAIKLALYSNRFLIKNMEMVGASRGFVQRPFILKALSHGIISGLLSILILSGLLYFIISKEQKLLEIIQWEMSMLIALGLLVAGILVYVISTWLIVRAYLRKSVDELF